MLSYPTRKARSFLINSLQPNGALLPFAAIATDAESGVEMGAVGQGSRLVLRSEKNQGSIRVEWGDQPGQQCLIDYRLPERDAAPAKTVEAKGYEVFDLPCRPVPPAQARRLMQRACGLRRSSAMARRIRGGLLSAWLLMSLCVDAQAALAITGTRFIYPANASALTVRVGNTGDAPILLQAWLDRGIRTPTRVA